MQQQPVLSERKQQILKAVAESYISSAAPVGSRHIVRDYVPDVSSATVRNDMVELEEAGLLFQPHTSAGRVPSVQGFRYFVEQLMEERMLPRSEQLTIRHRLFEVQLAREEWLDVAATVLARAARAAGIVSAPLPAQCQVKHFELLAIQERLGLLVIVLQAGTVTQQLVELPPETTQAALSDACARLNRLVHGRSSNEIAAAAEQWTDLEAFIIERLTSVMAQIDERERLEIYHAGLVELLKQPEFQQPEQARRIVHLLEHPEELIAVLPALPWQEGMHVLIGEGGARATVLRDLSIVVASYGLDDRVGGFVGVLGPIRLAYADAIPAVRYVAQVMTELLDDLLGPIPS